MSKINPTEAGALKWAQDKLSKLENQASQGDLSAAAKAEFLRHKLELAKRDLYFDGSNLFGKSVDTFQILPHHPVEAALGLGIAAAGAAILPGLFKALPVVGGAAFTWASSNLWESKHDGRAVEDLVKLSQAKETLPAKAGEETVAKPTSDTGTRASEV